MPKKSFVITKSTPADLDLPLISQNGQWNPRVKAYMAAAHCYHTGMEPEELVELYNERDCGLTQEEFHNVACGTMIKFPMTFHRYLRTGTMKDPEKINNRYKTAYEEFINYLYNRLYYMYHVKNSKKGPRYGITPEHPISKDQDQLLRQFYDAYRLDFENISVSPKENAFAELRNLKSVVLSMQTVLQQVMHSVDSIVGALDEHDPKRIKKRRNIRKK